MEQECLAIKWALDSLLYFLLGRRFRLVSDHTLLTGMRQNKQTNARMTKWFLSLQENFVVEHRHRRQHHNANVLSQVHCIVLNGASITFSVEAEGGICTGHQGWVLDRCYVVPVCGLWSL